MFCTAAADIVLLCDKHKVRCIATRHSPHRALARLPYRYPRPSPANTRHGHQSEYANFCHITQENMRGGVLPCICEAQGLHCSVRNCPEQDTTNMRLPAAVLSVLVITVSVTTTAVHSFAILPPTATSPATDRHRGARRMATAGRPQTLEARKREKERKDISCPLPAVSLMFFATTLG